MAKAKQKTAAKKKGAAKAAPNKAAPKKAAVKKAASAKSASKKTPKSTSKQTPKQTPKKATPAQKNNSKSVAPKSAAKSSAASGSVIDWQDFVTPLDDRLIVEMSAGERKTAGGLFLPDTVADLSGNFQGTVLVAGRGHLDKKGRVKPMDVKAGDQILFSEYSGSKINLQGKELQILRESEVLGIVVKK